MGAPVGRIIGVHPLPGDRRTPWSAIGYQTNLMVQGPGRYVFTDYLRAGLPLVAVTATIALIVIPMVWPF